MKLKRFMRTFGLTAAAAALAATAIIMSDRTEGRPNDTTPEKLSNAYDTAPAEAADADTIDWADGTTMDAKALNSKVIALSDEQREAYTRWVDKGKKDFGYYQRKIRQILNEAPEARRVTLEEVKAIIAEHPEFNAQLSEIQKIHGNPDFIGGSGLTIIEFELDDEGNDKVTVLKEQGDILYGDRIINP